MTKIRKKQKLPKLNEPNIRGPLPVWLVQKVFQASCSIWEECIDFDSDFDFDFDLQHHFLLFHHQDSSIPAPTLVANLKLDYDSIHQNSIFEFYTI